MDISIEWRLGHSKSLCPVHCSIIDDAHVREIDYREASRSRPRVLGFSLEF